MHDERLRRAIESGDADLAVRCAQSGEKELSGRRDIDEALTGYRAVVASGLVLSAESAVVVGSGLTRLGAKEEARAVCRSVLDREGEIAPDDMALLGGVLLEADDLDGAEAACRRAIESGDPTARAWATTDLGDIYARRGDMVAARGTYEQVVDSKHWEMAPIAALKLGLLLMEIGDRQGAMDAYELVVKVGVGGVRSRAALNLGVLRHEAGDWDGAFRAFKLAILEGSGDTVPRALVAMGALLRDRGELDNARKALRRAVESGHAEIAANAEELLADLDGAS